MPHGVGFDPEWKERRYSNMKVLKNIWDVFEIIGEGNRLLGGLL